MNATSAGRIMVSGWLRPGGAADSLEARRGMTVVDVTGALVGTLAGVLMDGATEAPRGLVLGCDVAAGDYRLVPVEAVLALSDCGIRLGLPAAGVAALPHHEAGDDFETTGEQQ